MGRVFGFTDVLYSVFVQTSEGAQFKEQNFTAQIGF